MSNQGNAALIGNNYVEDDKVDHLQRRTVFCIWSGLNSMSDQRKSCLESMNKNMMCPVVLVTPENQSDFVISGQPLHPAYEFLSETHKADYLRAYLMHNHGGGYSDIKQTSKSWISFFDELIASDLLCVGYPETNPNHVAPVGGEMEEKLRKYYCDLIGMGAFIFRPQTSLTQEWTNTLHEVLDAALPDLRRNPACWPEDARGRTAPDGSESRYPLAWTEILGNILHPIVLKYKDMIGHVDLAPQFFDYK